MVNKLVTLHCCIIDTCAGLVVAVANYELDWGHNHSCWQDWLETKRKRRSISGLLRCFLSVSFFITASILSEDQWCLVASMPLSGTIGFPRSICRGLGGPK